jgi:hypothetical protein
MIVVSYVRSEFEYHTEEVLGIFSSDDKAWEFIAAFEKSYNAMKKPHDPPFDEEFIRVEPWELDAPKIELDHEDTVLSFKFRKPHNYGVLG